MVNRIGTHRGDLLGGSEGDDFFSPKDVSQRPAGVTETDVVTGLGGIDTLEIGGGGSSITLTPGGVAGTWFVDSANGDINCDATGIERLLMYGSGANDSLNTGSASGSVSGGGGIDVWIANFGDRDVDMRFQLNDGFGILAVGMTVTDIDRVVLTTGSGDDRVVGGSRDDSFTTGAGDDFINLGSRVAGSPSGDFADGGAGEDTLLADCSSETKSVQLGIAANPTFFVRSESGNFLVDVSQVEKVDFRGGFGDDRIETGAGAIRVRGGGGIDHWLADLSGATSGIAYDVGSGGLRRDDLGLLAVDEIERITLVTSRFADTITGGAQADSLTTGAGADIINLKSRPVEGPLDFVDAGAGTDTLVADCSSETQSVTLGISGNPSIFLRSTSGNFAVDAAQCEKVIFTGGSAADRIETGSGAVRIDGRGGDDHWIADYGFTDLDVQFVLPPQSGQSSESLVQLGLLSLVDIARITLTTGSGDDRITGGLFGDRIVTGAGRDVVNLKSCKPGDGLTDSWDGGAGVDTLVVDARGEKGAVNLGISGNPSFFVRSDSGRFNIDVSLVEKVRFIGGDGSDRIETGSGAERIDGSGGLDRWIADYGATARNVTFILGQTQSLAPLGLESIRGIEALTLTTGRGDDRISGGRLADALVAGAGKDTLDAGSRQVGDAGDFVDGGGGIDTLVVDATGERSDITLGISGNPSYFVRSESGRYYVDAARVERVSFTGGQGDDTINTGRGAVLVDGGAGVDRWLADYSDSVRDVFFTLGQHSALTDLGVGTIQRIEALTLSFGKGDDRIIAGREADRILSGAGDDTLGAGSRRDGDAGDFLDGGAGFDTLLINASDENASGLQLGFNGDFFLRSGSGRYYIDTDNMEAVDFTGSLKGDAVKGGDNADTLRGSSGSDTLDGGLGRDLLDGGGGSDVYLFSTRLGSSNVDRIDFFSHKNDRIHLDDAIFTGIEVGVLKARQFVSGPKALDANDRIIWIRDTGALLYDADGSGAGQAVRFATIDPGGVISAGDILIV